MKMIRHLGYVYDKIMKSRKRQGTLKKCEFHFHTPASHDYELLPEKCYSDLSLEEIIRISYKRELFSSEVRNILLEDISLGKPLTASAGSPFVDFKEQLSYFLIVHELFRKNIEVVLITDHHTIDGFEKLKYARDKFTEMKKTDAVKFDVILGVEISCSDRNHVVGIFDHSQVTEVENLLKELVNNRESGTHLPSLQVLELIYKIKGIGYLAHVNTLNWQTDSYNKKLIDSRYIKWVGYTNYVTANNVIELHNCARKEICYIQESDAHNLDDIGKQNVWIKLSKGDFTNIKRALEDHKVCIYNTYPQKSEKALLGFLVVPGEEGFLINKKSRQTPDYKSKDFIVGFAQDLNCIIGGRGAGKSTILQVIESIFNDSIQNTQNKEFIHICRHEAIYVLFCVDGKEYLLRFIPQKDLYGNFLSRAFLKDPNGQNIISPNWFTLSQRNTEEKFISIDHYTATRIIRKFFRRGYYINSLVSQIDNQKITDFIREVVLQSSKDNRFKLLDKLHDIKSEKFYIKKIVTLIKEMKLVHEIEDDRVLKILKDFNQHNNNLLKVNYYPKPKERLDHSEYIVYIKQMLFSNNKNSLLSDPNPIEFQADRIKLYLSWDDVFDFILDCVNDFGYLEFLEILFSRRYSEFKNRKHFLNNYESAEATFSTTTDEYKELTPILEKKVFEKIYEKMSSENNRFTIFKSIEAYLQSTGEFSLEFNVNNKEVVSFSPSDMKDVAMLSLGQKVVALLTFIFKFGDFTQDDTPLILDQPEDNLDNQYIFKNLVESLRQIKNKRQVIIVTHSSTIVTNADAEQIIVMESDNKKGWQCISGYPNDKTIVQHIINHLEGGEASFRNKYLKYKLFIQKLNDF